MMSGIPSSYAHKAPQRIAILIPAYEPGHALERLVADLIEAGTPAILVVDDGSADARRKVFDRIALQPTVHVLRQSRHEGKGIALKTGISYFLEHLRHYVGLVTADADGQQTAEDVLRVARALQRSPDLAILGARTFDGVWSSKENMAVRRRTLIGNRVVAFFFRALTGVAVTDAQTGLRGLPTTLLPSLMTLPGKRYEYELITLLYIARSGHPLAEQPVRMLCDGIQGDTGFRPVSDSWRIFKAMFAAPHSFSSRLETAVTREWPATPETNNSRRPLHVKSD